MSSSTLSTSTGNAPTQRVPAWKRLGLKLKATSGDQSHTSTTTPTSTAPSSTTPAALPSRPGPINGAAASTKRKPSGNLASDHSAKKARRDNSESQQTPSKKAKSVTFAAETAESPAATTTSNGNQDASIKPKKKKKKQPTKNKAASATATPTAKSRTKGPGKQGPVNLEPALAYLRQWRTERATPGGWKFNKNHQTRLLEQVFADETTIPAADIAAFYEYIQGLQGGVRTRLTALARGVRAQDMETGFPETAGTKETRERKQKEYEEVIAAFLSQDRTPDKRRFEEVDYVLRTADMEMQRRVVKRMRAEMVVDELSDSGAETTTTSSSATTTTGSSSSGSGSGSGTVTQNGDGEVDGDGDTKRLSLNDASQQRVKRRRLRKSRTAAVDDESSSDSESDSSSSDSSDDDDDGGSKVRANPKPNAAAADTSDSSSSSSSSSSEASNSESESESDSDDSSEDDS